MSFRLRLLLTSLATLVIGLGVLVLAGNVLLGVRVRAEASSLLRARTEAQVAALKATSGRVTVRETPRDTLKGQSWVLDGDPVIERPAGASPELDRAAVALGRRRRVVERAGPDETRLRTGLVFARGSETPQGSVVVALSVEPFEHLQRQVLYGSLVVAALVVLAGGLAIRHAVDGALHPVALMTARAEDWGAHDLDRRFDLGAPRDELTGLAATLDHLLARIAASRRHEQRFASEVAHELRTPLAGLRGRAELAVAARGPGAEAARAAALGAVVDQAARLDRAIETLLAVARQELDPSADTVDLATLAREFDDVEVRVVSRLPAAEGGPEIVRRMLAPLVENARRHARGRVWLGLSADDGHVHVAVHDDGLGLDPEIGARAFEPGVRGSDAPGGGAGLGLALARRLARSCGGDVIAGDGPGGCFVLELPAVGAPSASSDGSQPFAR